MPERDDDFVATVRVHFDPVVLPAGFVFNSAGVGVAIGGGPLDKVGTRRPAANIVGETTVLYEAEPGEFAARFPALRTVMADAGPCLDLWVALEVDRGTVRVEFEGRSPGRLINEITREGTADEVPPDAVPADAGPPRQRASDSAQTQLSSRASGLSCSGCRSARSPMSGTGPSALARHVDCSCLRHAFGRRP